MLSCYIDNACQTFEYDSANRLIKSDYIDYVYDAEDVRIKTLSYTVPTTYIYNTNCKLSQLLYKKDNHSITKYVYGIGLIGEQRNEWYKIYHFDYRGSTVALTNICGMVTDTFKYDAYGNMTSRTGVTPIIFGYNGRDGVVTDANGLIYMRARYYSPKIRRFINADIIHGEITNAITLNRYAYANGNPVSNIDPFGLSVERGNYSADTEKDHINIVAKALNISYEHARILYYSSRWENHSIVEWTNCDIINWKTFGGSEFLFSKKASYISNYKDVIIDAANKYDIPVFLLAGIAYTEFGGDPLWLDDIAYGIRSFDWSGPDWIDEHLTITKNPLLTSFGHTSIQVRRALEMLNYDSSSDKTDDIITMLTDPIHNIYMAAKHLDVLRNVDFAGVSAKDLDDEAIQIIASRYNIGPERSIDDAKNWSYGKSIFNHQDSILKALE